jgi:hypothetical protein
MIHSQGKGLDHLDHTRFPYPCCVDSTAIHGSESESESFTMMDN